MKTLEQLIQECPHFWSLGISGDINKPKYCAYSLISTGQKGTIGGYGATPREAVENLYAELEKRKVVVTVQAENIYKIV